jgi:hypothetical protein
MKSLSHLFAVSYLATALVVSPAAFAAGKKKEASPAPEGSAAASPGTKKVRVMPFHGMVSAVDERAKTFTIAGKSKTRVFKVTDQSVITKTDAPATMKDIVANEEIRGSYLKEADGSLVAKTVKVGPLTGQEKAAEDALKAKRAERRAAKAAAAATAAESPAAAASASPKP